MRTAAVNGHEDILRLLATQFMLDFNDAVSEDNETIQMAVANGRAGVFAVLWDYFGVNHATAPGELVVALWLAITRGHANVLEALLHLGVGREFVHAADEIGLHEAASCGYANVLEILREYFKLDAAVAHTTIWLFAWRPQTGMSQFSKFSGSLMDSAQPTRARDNEALRRAAANGHAAVLEVLRDCFELDAADACAAGNEAAREATARGHTDVLAVLRDWRRTVNPECQERARSRF